MKYSFILSTALALSASVALAEAHATSIAADWSGAYAGLSYGSGDNGMSYNDFTTDFEYEEDSAFGVFGGYNQQNGNLVYGGELSIQSGYKGIVGFPDEELSNIIELRGRVGYAFNNILAYGFLGYASASYDDSFDSWGVSGVSFGAGVDYALPNNLFVGLEVLQRELEGDSSNAGQVQTNTLDSIALRVGYSF